MKLCKIIGFATSSIKREGLSSYKLLILEDIDEEGNPRGGPFIAVDTVGAGVSEFVAVTTGAPAACALSDRNLPVDAAVIAILDHITVNKRKLCTKNKES